jgi:hypothetical protein
MGVLVFGTPTLLLMGYDFITALSYLLPASFAISLLQVLVAGSARVSVSPSLYFLCLPGIGVGLLFTDTSTLTSWSNVLIGGTLLVSALVRIWEPAGSLLNVMLEKHLQTYHLVMGLIHGLTNLGGAMLAILASGLNTEKAAIRYTVAHYYLAFSTIQMLLLATVMGQHAVLLSHLFTGVVSTSVFFLVGNRIFVRASNPTFNIALTIFIAAYGVIILLKL